MPLFTGGAAKQYRVMSEALVGLDEFAAELRADGVDTSPLTPVVSAGQQLMAHLLAHVHKEARPGTHPDLMELVRALQHWQDTVRMTLSQLTGLPPTTGT